MYSRIPRRSRSSGFPRFLLDRVQLARQTGKALLADLVEQVGFVHKIEIDRRRTVLDFSAIFRIETLA
jgi:hypothetical protein